jgi:tRNA threonylcarbamoyladenosine biosynthesis protein TsaB
MRVLALDSAFGGITAAAADGATVLSTVVGGPDAKAAESLPEIVQSVLTQAGWSLADLDRIAVTLGPGGFTSLRAGLAFAKGLAMGAGKPLLGFTTLEALAASAPRADTPIVAAIDAKRDEVFLQVFDFNVIARTEALVVSVDRLAMAVDLPGPFRVCGSGARFLTETYGSRAADTRIVAPDAAALARHCRTFEPSDRPAEAVYLRAADARPMA